MEKKSISSGNRRRRRENVFFFHSTLRPFFRFASGEEENWLMSK
jgi:hypothetical protein